MSYLDNAAAAIRDMEKELDASGYRHSYPAEWRTRQSEIAEHWLKLAAVELGVNPWARREQAEAE
jgi:hypothetical protein